MKKEDVALLTTPPETLDFIRALRDDPENPFQKVSQKQAERLSKDPERSQALGVHLMAIALLSTANNRELGRIYKMSHSRVHQIKFESLIQLWKAASPELQARFSKEDVLQLGRKKRILNRKVYKSALMFLDDGDLDGPRSRGYDITHLRDSLQKLGVTIPKVRMRRKELAQQLQAAQTDEEIAEALQHVDRSFYDRYREKNAGEKIIVSIGEVASEFHFSIRNIPLFVQCLTEAGIPVARFKNSNQEGMYTVIAAQHLERAQEALRNDPRLESFTQARVLQEYGPPVDTLPSVTELIKTPAYLSLRSLLIEMGLANRGYSKLKPHEVFDENCPVPLFCYNDSLRSTYFFPKTGKSALRAYIKKRNRELTQVHS